MSQNFDEEQYRKRHIHFLKSIYQERVKANEELVRIRKNVTFFFYWFIATSFLFLVWLIVNS